MNFSIPEWPRTTKAYRELKKQIEKDEDFYIALSASLLIAQRKAYSDLEPDLFHAIDNEFGGGGQGWPTTPEDYLNYVEKYLVMIPNEQNDPEYPDAWTSDDSGSGYSQKVYDLLCQFYYLVNQPLPMLGITLQRYEHNGFKFADWLRDFAVDWGKFLDTEDSFPLWAKASFMADSMYNLEWYSDNAPSWKTFNEFFYREFNKTDKRGHSPLRPIAEPGNNNAIVSPADCTYKMHYPIAEDGQVLGIDGQPTSVTLKGTHAVFTVAELLQNEELAEKFHGGTFVHYFLNPFDYHRFHSPVNGKVKECEAVQGKVYLDVNVTSNGQFDAPDSAEGGYEFNQARGVFVVDTEGPMGLVAAVPIGMAQVSGVDMYHHLLDKEVEKGDEFGKFKFGGSDIIVLFQKNPDLYLWKKDPSHNPIHFQYGQVSAYWNVGEQV